MHKKIILLMAIVLFTTGSSFAAITTTTSQGEDRKEQIAGQSPEQYLTIKEQYKQMVVLQCLSSVSEALSNHIYQRELAELEREKNKNFNYSKNTEQNYLVTSEVDLCLRNAVRELQIPITLNQ